MTSKLGLAGLAFVSLAALGGCAEDYYGYGGANVGYGGGYGGGYYDDGYGGGYYDSGYFGWYGDYYYPGTGFYVYDRYRRPYRWNGSQQRYWEGRRRGYRGGYSTNWQGFDRSNDGNRQYRNDGTRGDGSDGRYRGEGSYPYRDNRDRGNGQNEPRSLDEGVSQQRQQTYRQRYDGGYGANPPGYAPRAGGQPVRGTGGRARGAVPRVR